MKDHFFGLVEKCTTIQQIKAVVECMDKCYQENQEWMQPDDWPELSRLVARRK